ncbi:MAG: hypothetical protein K0R84_2611, partial [Clostridia bacterium]|nr:hypothetical protein [Clostridia bacterium]
MLYLAGVYKVKLIINRMCFGGSNGYTNASFVYIFCE